MPPPDRPRLQAIGAVELGRSEGSERPVQLPNTLATPSIDRTGQREAAMTN